MYFYCRDNDDNVLIQSKIFKVKDGHDSDNANSSPLKSTMAGASTSSYGDVSNSIFFAFTIISINNHVDY